MLITGVADAYSTSLGVDNYQSSPENEENDAKLNKRMSQYEACYTPYLSVKAGLRRARKWRQWGVAWVESSVRHLDPQP
jgi:hypothetical protein